MKGETILHFGNTNDSIEFEKKIPKIYLKSTSFTEPTMILKYIKSQKTPSLVMIETWVYEKHNTTPLAFVIKYNIAFKRNICIPLWRTKYANWHFFPKPQLSHTIWAKCSLHHLKDNPQIIQMYAKRLLMMTSFQLCKIIFHGRILGVWRLLISFT